jgi:maltooligosyltrehalose trehalohydrolase
VTGASGTRRLQMQEEGGGFWAASDGQGAPGDLYLVHLGNQKGIPDIASRFQPHGVHGQSECIDPGSYQWQSAAWKRPPWSGQSIYEVHIGAMTRAGTFKEASERLGQIRDLGVEAVEIMPVADFAGDRNWGYDGVSLFAPARCYGRPDDLRGLVDRAHECGLAVILDVVYNHLGPQGNYFASYSSNFLRKGQETPWGSGFNLDGEDSDTVRKFLLCNAAYWLDDFRFDGLRLDATHAVADRSGSHILSQITELVQKRGGFTIAEDERNLASLVTSREMAGLGFDAVWADDFHHQVRVALTGTKRSYFSAFSGSVASITETLKNGWYYRGSAYPPWNGRMRGSNSDQLTANAFIHCIENHDQIGNRRQGERLEHLVSPGVFRSASTLLCLEPYPIMLFMGQEWAASSPFLFFCNHGGDLGAQIQDGRNREFSDQEGSNTMGLHDPENPAAFYHSKLNWSERVEHNHEQILLLYSMCLEIRRTRIRPSTLGRKDWDVLSIGPLGAIRYRSDSGELMLLFCLEVETLSPKTMPEPLQAPSGYFWSAVLCSNWTEFGGDDVRSKLDWCLKGPGTILLEAKDGSENAS